VFVLRKVFKLSREEISEVLGISTSTIEKHVAKGLVRCRDYLREMGLMEVSEGKTAAQPVRRLRHQGEGE
jgi:RNA polymerase sigma-70 factor (ECF subfamily)